MVHVFDADGELARSWMIQSDLLLVPWPKAELDDGSFLAWTEPILDKTPGLLHHQATLLRYREGSLEDTMATVPGSEVYSGPCRPGLKAWCGLPVPYGLVRFGWSFGQRATGSASWSATVMATPFQCSTRTGGSPPSTGDPGAATPSARVKAISTSTA